MRKCPKCGNENPDFINICTNCGTDLGYTDRHYPSSDEYEYEDDEYIETQDVDVNQEDNSKITDADESKQESDNQPVDNENIINQQGNSDGSQFIQNNQQQPNNTPTFNQQQMDYQNQPNNNEKKGFFDSNSKMKWALVGIILLIIVIAVALYYPTYQEQQDRQEFLDLMSSYAVNNTNESSNLMATTQNLSNGDYAQAVPALDNITNYITNETQMLQDYNKTTDNQTRVEFINLEVAYLDNINTMCNHTKALAVLFDQYNSGQISNSEFLNQAYPLSNQISSDADSVMNSYQTVANYIDQHQDLKTEFDDAGIYGYFHQDLSGYGYDSSNETSRTASST